GVEPEEALHALAHRAQEIGPGRQAIVARIAEDEHEGAAAEHGALALPEVREDAAEVRARMEIERAARRDVSLLDRHRAQAVDVGEEVHAAEVARRRRHQPEEQLAGGGDRAREIAQRHQVGATRPAPPASQAQRNAAAPDGGPQGPAQVEAAAAERTLAPGEAPPEPGAELAHQVARLGDVAGGEELERLLEQAPPPGGATAVLAPVARVARIRSRDGGARGAAALALLLRRLARPASRSTRFRRPAATGAGHRGRPAPAPAGTALLPAASQRERRVEEAVEQGAVALVLDE